MALMTCPECEKAVSEKAAICPHCGFPVQEYLKEAAKKERHAKRVLKRKFTDDELKEALDGKSEEAKDYVADGEKFERLVEQLEKALRRIPKIGEYAGDIACMVSIVRSYIKKEYTEIPLTSILGIVAALLYVVSPFDLIPDKIPIIGVEDDRQAILFALKMMRSDIEAYKKWRTTAEQSPTASN